MWLIYKRREELQKARAGQAELKGEIEGLERRMGTHAAEKASLQEKEKQLEQKKVSLWNSVQGAENSFKRTSPGLLRLDMARGMFRIDSLDFIYSSTVKWLDSSTANQLAAPSLIPSTIKNRRHSTRTQRRPR